jgi:hypothetical protein
LRRDRPTGGAAVIGTTDVVMIHSRDESVGRR